MSDYKREDGSYSYPALQPMNKHPWGEFLDARYKCIVWMKDELKRPYHQISKDLSMDEEHLMRIIEAMETMPKDTE